MDEATQTLSPPHPRANPPLAPSALITTAALYPARQQIKNQLKARGEKVALLPARHLTLLAEQYLADHRAEFIAVLRSVVAFLSPFGARLQTGCLPGELQSF